ncbi:MAG: hypothetical protein ACI9OJ_001350 [Myxococcota bacterium]|jgi:hypothetical protein
MATRATFIICVTMICVTTGCPKPEGTSDGAQSDQKQEPKAEAVEPPAKSEPVKAEAKSAERDGAKLAIEVRNLFADKCYHCHGDGEAESDVYILDHARLLRDGTVKPSDLESPLNEQVQDGSMPQDDELDGSQKKLVADWISVGAPAWPEKEITRDFLTEAELVSAVEGDLRARGERDRQYTRYFSIAHLYNAGASDEQLESMRTGLSKLVNSLSWQRVIKPPIPIGAERVLLRVDLRDYDWVDDSWTTVLARYPYAVLFTDASAVKALSGAPVPWVRADWFVAAASVPPLYHEMLGLPLNVSQLEERLGVDVARNLKEEHRVLRAGVRKSGVSRHNRVVERHESNYGAYWKSYDFSSSAGEQDIFRDPIDFKAAGGEMVFNLPNGLQAYLITDERGRRIDVAPVEIVSNRTNPSSPQVINGRPCMSCHFKGIKDFTDDVRPVLLETTGSATYDRDKALALYPAADRMARHVSEDIKRFRDAVEKTGGHLGGSHKTEPITLLSRQFTADLSAAHAAAEMGLPLKEFRQRIRAASDNAGFPQLLVEPGGVKRDQWEQGYKHAAKVLASAHMVSMPSLPETERPARSPSSPPKATPPSTTRGAARGVGNWAPAVQPTPSPSLKPAPAAPKTAGSCDGALFVGDWLVTTRVFRGRKASASGVNGYYGIRVSGSGCELQVEMSKVAFTTMGKIKEFPMHKRQNGSATLELVPGKALAKLGVRLARPDGSRVQTSEYVLLSNGKKLEGIWHYTGKSWASAEMRGSLVGQPARSGYARHKTIDDRPCLVQCALRCDVVRPEDTAASSAVGRFQRCTTACAAKPRLPVISHCAY